MSAEQGELVAIAFQTVRECHEGVRRLIVDLDGHMTKKGWCRIGDYDSVTADFTRAAKGPHWMAKRLFLRYANPDATPGIVEGVNIRFFAEQQQLHAPILYAGRCRYAPKVWDGVKKRRFYWDFENGYGKWAETKAEELGVVATCRNEAQCVEKMCVVAVNLYSIEKVDDVVALLDRVRQEFDAEQGTATC